MKTQTRSMALDGGTSADAEAATPRAVIDRVRAMITTLLREYGSMTDEEIADRYLARAGAHPLVPMVTAQRIRTVRHELVVDGLVHDTQALGYSKLGNRATVWGLT